MHEKAAGRPQARSLPVTIHDVASAAGVSVATVSKVLNEQGTLRAETRARVLEAAHRLRFRPNALAQSLHRRRSSTVGLLSNDLYGRFTLPILAGVEHALAAHNVSVFLCTAADGTEQERLHIESLLAKRVDGLIVTARRIDAAFPSMPLEPGTPSLYVNLESQSPVSTSFLPDETEGARLATAHLLALGRRCVAHVTGPVGFRAVQLRAAGYRQALLAAGHNVPAVLHGAWSEAWGHEAVDRLFGPNSAARPDAIFCGSDQIARGIADGLRERGIAVPGDVALVGFDNWEIIAAATRPPLTSVDPNLHRLGMEAGKCLIDTIEGKAPQRGILYGACTLVVRQSCGAAR